MSREAKCRNRSALRARIDMLNLADRFFESSVLFALAKLIIFELIREGDRPWDEFAPKLGIRAETLARLLIAGIVLKLRGPSKLVHPQIHTGSSFFESTASHRSP